MVFTGLPPAQLLGAFAGLSAVVVGLYLLKLRRRPLLVPFSPLWTQLLSQSDVRRLWTQLRRWLSLALQLVLVAALVLALGDPRDENALAEGQHWVVLVDTSASMQATDVPKGRWRLGVERAKRLVSGLGANDQALIVAMGARPKPLSTMTGDAKELNDALDSITPTAAGADLGAALRFAEDALTGKPGPKVLLLSDGAVGDEALATSLDVSWYRLGEGGANVALTAFSVRRYPLDHARYEAFLELANPSSDQALVELTLWGDDEVVDISRLELAPGEVLPRFYSDLGGASRHLKATVRRLNGKDHLPTDDVAFALLPSRRQVNILTVSAGNSYLEAALLLDEYLKVTPIAPGQPLPEGTFDVTILDDVAPQLTAAQGARIYLGSAGPNAPVGTKRAITDFGFDSWRKGSPFLRWMALENIQVAKGHALAPAKGDTVEGASELGPILVSGRRDGLPFLQLGFSPRDSDMVLRVGWPLFLLNAINVFSGDSAEYVSGYRTGRVWHIPAQTEAKAAELILPSGKTLRVPIQAGRALHFGDQPGFYRLQTLDGEPLYEFAANAKDLHESDLAVPDTLAVATTRITSIPQSTRASRYPAWMWLVLGVLGISLIEWQLYHRRVTV